MDVLAKHVVVVDGRTYHVRVLATAHHVIAQASEGPTVLLELRASLRALQAGVLLGKLQGDRALIADVLARAVQDVFVKGSATPDLGFASDPSQASP